MFVPLCLLSMGVYAQQSIDLDEFNAAGKLEAVNREVKSHASPGAVMINARQNDGMVHVKEVSFETGTIEVELLGANKPGQSFIGLAFNVDGRTYEAVYFRPFNFVAKDPAKQNYMVQYMALPDYNWRTLRGSRPGEFEGKIEAAPNPDDWFKTTIVVKADEVLVYVADQSEPVLQVERLIRGSSENIALWVGNNSEGGFRNLTIKE